MARYTFGPTRVEGSNIHAIRDQRIPKVCEIQIVQIRCGVFAIKFEKKKGEALVHDTAGGCCLDTIALEISSCCQKTPLGVFLFDHNGLILPEDGVPK